LLAFKLLILLQINKSLLFQNKKAFDSMAIPPRLTRESPLSPNQKKGIKIRPEFFVGAVV
tara:strand:- start:1 stop:180 length:180 start_codon:yes stop_codon:yes gene_type:complete